MPKEEVIMPCVHNPVGNALEFLDQQLLFHNILGELLQMYLEQNDSKKRTDPALLEKIKKLRRTYTITEFNERMKTEPAFKAEVGLAVKRLAEKK